MGWLEWLFYPVYNSWPGYWFHVSTQITPQSRAERISVRGTPTELSSCTVYSVPIFDTNYAYIIIDRDTDVAALVDPADPYVVYRKAIDLGVKLSMSLTTHKHWDHAGGNWILRDLLPDLDIIAPEGEIVGKNRNMGFSTSVKHGDTIYVGKTKLMAIETPTHTSHHMCYAVMGHRDFVGSNILSPSTTDHKNNNSSNKNSSSNGNPSYSHHESSSIAEAIFTGDFLFAGGAGKFFEGNGKTMLDSLRTLIKHVGNGKDSGSMHNTYLFFGHEYTLDNLAFANWLDPNNAPTRLRLERLQTQIQANNGRVCSVPSRFDEEEATNPYVRCVKAVKKKNKKSGSNSNDDGGGEENGDISDGDGEGESEIARATEKQWRCTPCTLPAKEKYCIGQARTLAKIRAMKDAKCHEAH